MHVHATSRFSIWFLSCPARKIDGNYLVGKSASWFDIPTCQDVASPDQIDEAAQTVDFPAGFIRTCAVAASFGGCVLPAVQKVCPKTCNSTDGCPKAEIQDTQQGTCGPTGSSNGFRSGSGDTSYGECKVPLNLRLSAAQFCMPVCLNLNLHLNCIQSERTLAASKLLICGTAG